jgi:hypothetical protein
MKPTIEDDEDGNEYVAHYLYAEAFGVYSMTEGAE